MAETFIDYRRDLSPSWLRGERGAAWQEAIGSEQDAIVERARAAAKMGYPEHAPSDALALIGDERRIERWPDEPEDVYRERLRQAFETWRWAGTRRGMIQAFAAGGYVVDTVANRQWDPSPPDGDTARWARFWVVLGRPHGIDDDGLWADDSEWGEEGSPGVWGTDATLSLIDRWRREIAKWKPGHARCVALIVNFDSERLDLADEPLAVAEDGREPLSTGERIGVWRVA